MNLSQVMKTAIMQPYFLPYLGYFHLIDFVDTFVIYDCVQYIRRGWIHRNRIQSEKPDGWEYINLRIQKAPCDTKIKHMKLNMSDAGRADLLENIKSVYAASSQFHQVFPIVEEIIGSQIDDLTGFLEHSLRKIMHFLDITANVIRSSTLNISDEYRGQQRIIEICRRVECTHYVNPSGGRDLYDTDSFASQGIRLSFVNPQFLSYRQHLYQGAFIPGLSILDVIMENSPEQLAEQIRSYTLGD